MNKLMVTVVGWAASTPKEISGEGVPFTSFRLASTPRYFDTKQGAWAAGPTEWLTVKVFRDVALNVAASVRKGDPVLVHGRLRTEEWEGEKGTRMALILEASALGHDLTRGRANFARTSYRRPEEPEAAGPEPDAATTEPGEDEVDAWTRREQELEDVEPESAAG